MKQTIKAGLLTGAAACLTLALTLQVRTQAARRLTPPETETAQQFYVSVETEAADGARVEVRDASGTLADSARVENGGCVVQLSPGSYTAQTGTDAVQFVLLENAAIGGATGDGWADGEVLHLTAAETGSLTVFRMEGAGVYRYTLSGDGGDFAGVIDYSFGRQDIWRSCRFDGVPAGRYTLFENGVEVREVTVEPGNNSIRLQ